LASVTRTCSNGLACNCCASSAIRTSAMKWGMWCSFPAPEGKGSFAGAVQQVRDDAVLFDFNHPLAGHPVTFEVLVIGVL